LGILQYVAANEKTRKELDLENYYLKAMEGMFGKQYNKIEEQVKTIGEQAGTIAEKDAKIAAVCPSLIGTRKH
jgi:predicted transposase YdaD